MSRVSIAPRPGTSSASASWRVARSVAALLCLAAFCAWSAAPLRADDESVGGEIAGLPPLLGLVQAEAESALSDLGLEAEVVTIAGPGAAPGRVVHQDPAAGEPFEPGQTVVLRVGVSVEIPTMAPHVVGLLEGDAVAALRDAYFLEVEYGPGPSGSEGRVTHQTPRSGAEILHRARFVIRVVRNAILVPGVVGRTETQARAAIEALGLRVESQAVHDEAAPTGTVISQDPRTGAEIMAGGTVALRVVHDHAEDGPEAPLPDDGDLGSALVPNLVGLGQQSAERLLLDAGLLGFMRWVTSPGNPALTVVAQEVAPGARVPAGSSLAYDVVRPAAPPSQIVMPNLFGMAEPAATAVLTSVGLGVRVVRSQSSFPAGTVFAQHPSASETATRGTMVEIRVALQPPPAWTPPHSTVPNVVGLSSHEARLAIMLAGFVPDKREGTSPGSQPGRVYQQSVAPGTPAGFGTIVRYWLPLSTHMPHLLGKSREEAIAALVGASLDANAVRVGPAGPGATQVIWQEHPVGLELARQTQVTFRYKVLLAVMKAVPDVVNMSRPQADALLQAHGFQPHFVLNGGMGPQTKVVSQNPAAGAMRPAGSTVTAHYIRTLGGLAKAVPHVIGMTRDDAKAAILAEGFQAHLILLGGVGTQTKVESQQPAGGTLAPVGSQVVARYKRHLVLGLKAVPNVVGLTRPAAQAKLTAEGFTPQMVSVGGPAFGTSTEVVSQSPPAGTMKAPGSTVQANWKKVLGVLPPAVAIKPVPPVVGMTRAAGQAALVAAGFQANMVKAPGIQLGPNTTIVSQNPVAGTLRQTGTQVTAVWKHVLGVMPPIGILKQVPSVINQLAPTAKANLEAAGFQVSFGGIGPRVKVQNPAGGAQALAGSTIHLTRGF